MSVDFDDLRNEVVREIDSYVYSVPAGALVTPWPDNKVRAQLDQLRQSLVRPYSLAITLRDTHDQITADPPITAECVIVADDGDGYLVFFDPKSNDFGLAESVADGPPTTIGVNGDVVGVFMAR